MNWIAQILAVVVGLIVIGVGALEATQYRNQRFHSMFLIKPEDATAVRLWVVNQGIYNVVWGLGIILGVVLVATGSVAEGRTLVLFGCAAHVIFGVALGITEPKLIKSMFYQAVPPLLVILLMLLVPS